MITTIDDVKVISLQKYTDERGTLVPVELEKDNNAVFKRSFFVFDVPKSQTRGYHAHKKSEQLLICPTGRCTVIVRDGSRSRNISLDSPEKCIHIPAMIWNEILYEEEGTLLIALATERYSKKEYILDWQEFANTKSERGK